MSKDSTFIEIRERAGNWEFLGKPSHTVASRIGNDHGAIAIDPDVFARWKWTGAALEVETCWSGVVPLYYYRSPDRVIVSPSLATVATRIGNLQLDYPALAVFLRLGYFLGDKTPFKEIRVVGPGVCTSLPSGSLSSPIPPAIQESPIGLSEAMDEYINLFRSSVSNRRPTCNDYAMPITGGRDSRHILLELLRLKRPPKFLYTSEVFPPRLTRDIEIGREIAEHFGIPHEIIKLPLRRVPIEIDNIHSTDYCSDEHSWASQISIEVKSRTSEVYDGINGGILFGRIGSKTTVDDAKAERLEKVARSLLNRSVAPESFFSSVLRADFRNQVGHEVAVAEIESELRRHVNQPNPLQSFYFWNRLRRETSLFTFGVMSYLNSICPFMDRQLCSFALSLPPEVSSNDKFQEEALRRHFPEATGIAFDSPSRRSPTVNSNYARAYAFDLAWRLVRNGCQSIETGLAIRQAIRTIINGRLSSMDWIGPEQIIYMAALQEITAPRLPQGVQ